MSPKPLVITNLTPELTTQRLPRRTPLLMAIAGSIALIAGALIGGGLFQLYDTFWWWDDLLHGFSGCALALWGWYIAVKATDGHKAISPLFGTFFAFCFALAGGVCWEIFEFLTDLSLHTAMQQWDMTSQAIVMGASYQGMGLRDTMSDLILATVGASVTTSILYALVSQWPVTVLSLVRRAIARS